MRLPANWLFFCVAAAWLAVGSPVRAGEGGKKVNLKVGDKAPAFLEHDDSGKIWNSADHVGKEIVVVFFFPVAFTGG